LTFEDGPRLEALEEPLLLLRPPPRPPLWPLLPVFIALEALNLALLEFELVSLELPLSSFMCPLTFLEFLEFTEVFEGAGEGVARVLELEGVEGAE